MSFGSQSGRTRSGSKGFSGKEKKLKRKKQEFHTHKRSYDQEVGRPDPEEVRTRTLLTLDRLGHQVLSTEPGGYDLEHWLKSLNSLLDDFQDRVGLDSITDEFRRQREEATRPLVLPSSRDIESELLKLALEESEAEGAIQEAKRKAAARLASLREERVEREKELKAQRERLSEIRKSKQSRGVFSRMLRAGPSSEEAEAAVAKLESDLRQLDDDIERSRKARAIGEGDPALLEAQERLESARAKLSDLHSTRETSLQLAKEREAATQAISAAISSMKLEGTASGTTGVGAVNAAKPA